jgi:predicted nucleic-acid-binding Zn-ribbon protein
MDLVCIYCGLRIKIKETIIEHDKYLIVYCDECGIIDSYKMTGGLQCHHLK